MGRPIKLKQLLFLKLVMLSLMTPLSGFAAVILQYHHVSSETPPVTSISPEQFLQHMTYLKDNHFKVVRLEVLVDKIRKKQPIDDKTIVITFDDAYNNVYQNARPILKKFDWPYTVFINPKYSDKGYSRHMTWKQLNQIAKEKATLANHTLSHDYLVRNPSNRPPKRWLYQMLDDIELAESRLKAITGQNHKMLAYPYGEFSLALTRQLMKRGYVGFGQHSGAVGHYTNLARIPRFPASGIYANLDKLKLKMESLPFAIKALGNADMVIKQNPPTLTIAVKVEDFLAKNVQCFIGSARAKVSWTSEDRFTVTSPNPLPKERSRYNCTAPSISKPGRFYWFSQPWLNLL